MKVDIAGNVYTGGTGGIWILDPERRKLGRIVHGYPATNNIGFGGDDWKTLYFVSRTVLGAVNLKIAGPRCRHRNMPKGHGITAIFAQIESASPSSCPRIARLRRA
jgi:hypothetical protein